MTGLGTFDETLGYVAVRYPPPVTVAHEATPAPSRCGWRTRIVARLNPNVLSTCISLEGTDVKKAGGTRGCYELCVAGAVVCVHAEPKTVPDRSFRRGVGLRRPLPCSGPPRRVPAHPRPARAAAAGLLPRAGAHGTRQGLREVARNGGALSSTGPSPRSCQVRNML